MTIKKITIEITASGAAFEDNGDYELTRILRAMADRIEDRGIPPVPRDINGNVCGSVTTEME